MNKSERLTDMILFLSDKNSFNLKDLMNRYKISKSTALRDISSLESIGMPIYAKYGRNGYYGLLNNKLLSPIVFNIDEVFALYFSMCTLNAYETTPFHLSLEKLKLKFESCLSKEKINALKKMEKVFSFASIKQNNPSPFLRDIVNYAINEKVCTILYKKDEIEKEYIVQFFKISSSYGQWYVTGYNYKKRELRVFRCDKILKIKESFDYFPKKLSDFMKSSKSMYKKDDAIDFTIEITKKAVDLYYKEHYPSMRLYSKSKKYFINGFYNLGEEDFISSYFINYGNEILSIEPYCLKNLIIQKLSNLNTYLSSI